MCIIGVNQWVALPYDAMLFDCVSESRCVSAFTCVCVLPSCPQACDPDVRLWALRTRQEHIVSCVRSARTYPSNHPHVVSIRACVRVCVFVCFGFCFFWHIVIFKPWAPCGSSRRRKSVSDWLCVRGRLYLLCLHLLIVCTHMAGDANAPGYAGGHIGERLVVGIVILGCQRESEGNWLWASPETTLESRLFVFRPIQNTKPRSRTPLAYCKQKKNHAHLIEENLDALLASSAATAAFVII